MYLFEAILVSSFLGAWRGLYFVASLGIKENPPEFNDFGGVFCDKDAVLIAGRSNVDHYITVKTRFLPWIVCHSEPAKFRIDPSAGERSNSLQATTP